jgi:hypothetical protein
MSQKQSVIESIDVMSNLNFCEHMDAFNPGEALGGPLVSMPQLHDCWVVLYRTIHDIHHDSAARGDRKTYNHEHLF